MKISFELSAKDIRYFRERLQQARESARDADEATIIGGARDLIVEASNAEQPEFVRERLTKLEQLIRMLDDAEWKLQGEDRTRILDALAYFVDPDDLIPDRVPGIGYLDDAIMVELVVRELRHEIDAYQDFCDFRSAQKKSEPSYDEAIAARREGLQRRMRRRRRREREVRRSSPRSRRSSMRLW